MLTELTTVPQSALPLARLRAHLRLPPAPDVTGPDVTGTGEAGPDESGPDATGPDATGGTTDAAAAADLALLAGFLRAALSAIENRTSRALYQRDFLWTLPRWRGIGAVALPIAPVTAVAGITIRSHDGGLTEVPAGLWQLRPDNTLHGGRLGLPRIPAGGEAQVSFTAGYGPAFTDLPADLQQAVVLLAAHYFDFRHDTALGAGCMPFGVTALIEGYRHLRLTLAGVEMLQ